ncbi:two-component system sensor histidine kinase CreC [Pseudoalteromonas ostreae]|uniref:two-component system sensor histidine kinase CreC n=1 Tax=Pseudoalteromonas ostreae TaxID=2774154 RepID=UPI001B36DC29|nr:two-component system sensor histidine kinase CreC [Pseudoalteromonas ostreae]
MNPPKQVNTVFSRLKRWPKIPLGLRLFLLYFVLVILTAYLVSSTVMREIKPTVRQASEETLVDMANMLAVMASNPMASGDIAQSAFAKQINFYGLRNPDAAIWGVEKKSVNHRVYITDQQGIVVLDSWQQDVGNDFSKWNDVYLTLRGEYGARSTALDPNDPLSTVMHVAAPILYNNEIIGSVTVAKANRSVQPFIDISRYRVLTWLALMSVLALIIGALIAWRINTALYKLADYADKMGLGEKTSKPTFRVFYEYSLLSDALENMRRQLDGKRYVENYVQTLTHELKSPLSAIKGASEILQTPTTVDKQQLFAQNIETEATRMQQLIDKLLALTKLEQLPELEQRQSIDLPTLLSQIKASCISRLMTKQVELSVVCDNKVAFVGDQFLIQQALYNLFENALDFVYEQGKIKITVTHTVSELCINVENTGPKIPDYALERVTERFYSLARSNGQKSTGLGLNFVEQVVKLHKGKLIINNTSQGVSVQLFLPTP